MSESRHSLGMVALLTVAEVMIADLKTALTLPEQIQKAPTADETVRIVDESITILAKMGENMALFAGTYGAVCNGIAEERERTIKLWEKILKPKK